MNYRHLRPRALINNAQNTKIYQKDEGYQQVQIYLLKQPYSFNVFKYATRSFTIIANNSSYKFNIYFLKETSSLIRSIIEKDPHNLQYNLTTENGGDIMKRLELLFLGEKASFSQTEEDLFFQVIDELKMRSLIGLRKPNSTAPPRHDNNFKGIFFNGHRFGTNGFELEMNLHNFEMFLSEKMEKTFTILTKSNEYKCNIIGVNSSKLIREFLIKNPDSNQYEYDFDDKFDEFNSICQFFNFQKVEITVDNMDTLKEIADDLQIDINIDEVDKYIDDFEQRIQVVDDVQSTINSISELFDNLNKIKEITVENVKRIIVDSVWCKTEENVLELAALILQVIQTNNLLHPYLVDLIELLGKEADESNKLEILIPCISKKLLNLLDESKLVCNFVFFLHKRGFIQKEEIMEKLNEKIFPLKLKIKNNQKNFLNNNNPTLEESYIVFLPEILEIVEDKFKIMDFFPENLKSFILSQLKDECKNFKQIRDKGEPNDQITKSLREDDITTFQRIVTMNQINITKKKIEFNIFEKFNNLSYIDYAAAYGSIQCFKYLLLNHADLNELSFEYAVYGGNIEIIKTINDIPPESLLKDNKETKSLSAEIIPAIETHQNELYVWIFENKYTNAIENDQLINEILISASKNGDLFSIANITDKGYDFAKLNNGVCRLIIENTLKNGFFKLLEFISTILHKKIKDFVFDSKLPVCFGNLSIFKISHKKFKIDNIYDTVIFSLENKYESIIKYIFDNMLDTKLLEGNNIYNIISNTIHNKNNDLFIYIFKKLDQMESNPLLANSSKFMDLISESCYERNLEITKELTELIIDKKEDFTPQFFNAAVNRGSEICQYFIDKKVFINFDELSFQIKALSTINKDVFDIIIKNSTPKAKESFVNFYLDYVIEKKNKVFLEYLLKENAKSDDALFKAVKTNDIEIVNMILDHNSKLSFINQVSSSGSALNIAVSSNYITIVKRLLSIPGINPNFYDDKEGNTPLIQSIINSNFDIAKLLIECDNVDINYRNFTKKTALTEAVNQQFLEIVDLLINNKKFDPIESRINYAFISSDDTEILTKLAAVKGFDVNLKSLNTGDLFSNYLKGNKMLKFQSSYDLVSTPLTAAFDNKNYESIDIIINHPNFDPDKSMLNKAIFKACKCNNTCHICKLLKVNNDVNIKDETGQFLLEAAINCRNMDLMDMILNHKNFDPKKCNFLKIFIDACTDSYLNNSVFNKLADYVNEHENIIDFNHLLPDGKSFFTLDISFSEDIINFLLKQGVDLNKPDKFGVYPLENAIKKENYRFCELLIDSGKIDFSLKIPKIIDPAKYTTYLHLAAVSTSEIFSLFIDKKLIDINITDSEGETPLMACCEAKTMENINSLFEEDDLDYLHCNNKGEDAFAILQNKVHNSKIEPTKDKDEYLNKLKLLLNKTNLKFLGSILNDKDAPFTKNPKKMKSNKENINQNNDTNKSNKKKGKNKIKTPFDSKRLNIYDIKYNKFKHKKDSVKNTKIQSIDTNKDNPKPLPFSLNYPLKNDSKKITFSNKMNDSNSQIETNKTEEDKISPSSSFKNDQNNDISSHVSSKEISHLLNFDKKCTAKSQFHSKRTNQGKKFSSSPLKKDQNNETKPQESPHKNSKDTEKDEKTLSFSFNFSKKSNSESQNEANKTGKDSNSSSSPLENNQNSETKQQESPHENSKDTEKDEKTSSFSFNFSKNSDSNHPLTSDEATENSNPSPFTLKNDQNCGCHSDSSNSLDVSPCHQTTEYPLGDDSSIQNEIVTSILESLDDFTPDEARRVSSVLSSIVTKEVQKITAKIDSQENNQSETGENSQPQNQFKFETKTVNLRDNDASISDDQTEKKESTRSSKSNDKDIEDHNQFNHLYDEYQNQMMMQQWNQIMQSNSIRNVQFNLILQQQEQMMRSLMCEKKEKSSKNKHKKSKKKNHK